MYVSTYTCTYVVKSARMIIAFNVSYIRTYMYTHICGVVHVTCQIHTPCMNYYQRDNQLHIQHAYKHICGVVHV